jgi:hypothetical protein
MDPFADAHARIVSVLDYSTIHLELLRQQPTYSLPAGYRFTISPGICCAGDPPGYPRHFLWSVVTHDGYGLDPNDENGPGVWVTDPHDPRMLASASQAPWCSPERPAWLHGRVIADPDDATCGYVVFGPTLPALWKPLAEDSARVQCWLQDEYAGMSPDRRELGRIAGWYPELRMRLDWCGESRPPLVQTQWWTVLAQGPLRPEDVPQRGEAPLPDALLQAYYLDWWGKLLPA